MPRHLPSTLSLRAFEAAARRTSFSAAAEELSLSQSTVSYRVRQLEELLRLELFVRGTRRIELTEAGKRFLPAARETLERLEREIAHVRAEHRPQVRLRVSTYFAMRWLSPRLRGWERIGCADVVLDHGDPDAAGAPDLVIRWGRDNWPGWRRRPLLPTAMTPYCSPAVARRLQMPADVLGETLLSEPDGYDLWPEWLAAAGLAVRPARRLVLTDSNVRIRAAVDGRGVVLADHLAEPEVEARLLVKAFPIAAEGAGYHILTRDEPTPVVVRFIDWLTASAEA